MQLVEREVETASEDSGSPNSILRAGKFEGSHTSLPWLTEWRLRLALTSPRRYQVPFACVSEFLCDETTGCLQQGSRGAHQELACAHIGAIQDNDEPADCFFSLDVRLSGSCLSL